MDKALELGSLVIIDGQVWTVESFPKANTARATSETAGRAIWFAVADVAYLGGGLFGMPGRIEAPAVQGAQATIVADAAVATLNT